jgi:thiamine-phosphate pyrophosphorylase
MLVIIVSNPTALKNEAVHINELFKQGMQLFHLRKPNYTLDQMEELLKQIDSKNYPLISLHQHHGLAEKYDLKRIHFPEFQRKETNEIELQKWKVKGFTLSTSIHDLEEYKNLSELFDYAFYGPVYTSISKPNYKPKQEVLPKLEQKERKVKLIAIGGVDADKLMALRDAGFDGAALLGAVWNSLNAGMN